VITLQVLLVVKGPHVVQWYGTMICLERLLSVLNVVVSELQRSGSGTTDQGAQHAWFEKGRPKINGPVEQQPGWGRVEADNSMNQL
jgi:hypothetical protein